MQLNYKVLGQGEPLIVLHGLMGSLDNWQSFARVVSEQFTVYIVDQRNHGRSPWSNEFNYELLAQDLLQFMDEHSMYSAHLLGHSMGGKTVMNFAKNYPDMVDKLIVADIAPVQYAPGHDLVFEALFAVNLEKTDSRTAAEEVMMNILKDYVTVQFLMKSLYRKEEGGFAWRFNLESIYKNYQEILANPSPQLQYKSDCLFIKGQQSNYINWQNLDVIQSQFPSYQLEEIEGAGHWLHAEKPDEFLRSVLTYLYY